MVDKALDIFNFSLTEWKLWKKRKMNLRDPRMKLWNISTWRMPSQNKKMSCFRDTCKWFSSFLSDQLFNTITNKNIWLKFDTNFEFHVQVAVQISGKPMINAQVLFHSGKHAPCNNGKYILQKWPDFPGCAVIILTGKAVKVAPYSFTIAHVLITKAQEICARRCQHEHKKQNWQWIFLRFLWWIF